MGVFFGSCGTGVDSEADPVLLAAARPDLSVSAIEFSVHVFNPSDLPVGEIVMTAFLSRSIVHAGRNTQLLSLLNYPVGPMSRIKCHHYPVAGLARAIERQPFGAQ